MSYTHCARSASLWISAALLAVSITSGADAAEGKLGGLTCHRIAGTGVNLLIHSSADVRCTFADNQGSEQWYKGETGVALGLDLKWSEKETIYLGVLSSTLEFAPEGNFLTGNYGGAKADVGFGRSAGVAVLVGGSRNTLALQPAVQTGEGTGVAAGLGYLNLKPDPLNHARVAIPQGDLFSKVLYSGYFDRAYGYRKKPNYAGSDFFAAKSLGAATGNPPMPLSALADHAETAQAHRRLMAALEHTKLAPIDAARSQVSYDCWIYALAQKGDGNTAECSAEMNASLAKVEAAEAEYAALLESEAKVAERARWNLMQPFWQTVLFATDSSVLDREAAVVISKAVKRIAGLEEANIILYGSADKSGTKKHNLALSSKRIASVKAALIAAGIPEARLDSESYGSENPVLQFTRNRVDAWSRRVDISVEPKKFKQEAFEKEFRRIMRGN